MDEESERCTFVVFLFDMVNNFVFVRTMAQIDSSTEKSDRDIRLMCSRHRGL